MATSSPSCSSRDPNSARVCLFLFTMMMTLLRGLPWSSKECLPYPGRTSSESFKKTLKGRSLQQVQRDVRTQDLPESGKSLHLNSHTSLLLPDVRASSPQARQSGSLSTRIMVNCDAFAVPEYQSVCQAALPVL